MATSYPATVERVISNAKVTRWRITDDKHWLAVWIFADGTVELVDSDGGFVAFTQTQARALAPLLSGTEVH